MRIQNKYLHLSTNQSLIIYSLTYSNIMKKSTSHFTEQNLKKGDSIYISAACGGHTSSTIQYSVQEYKVHSIGKKRMYLIIGDDVMSKKAYLYDWTYGFAKTQEQAIELCSNLYKEYIEGVTNDVIEKNSYNKIDWYNKLLVEIVENCKTAKLEILINPKSK